MRTVVAVAAIAWGTVPEWISAGVWIGVAALGVSSVRGLVKKKPPVKR